MDCFELCVRYANSDERRNWPFIVEKILQIGESLFGNVIWRRNKKSVSHGAPMRSNPVLRFAEFSGVHLVAPCSSQQTFMDFFNQPSRKWNFFQASQAVVHCRDVVDYLRNICWPRRIKNICFRLDDVVQ